MIYHLSEYFKSIKGFKFVLKKSDPYRSSIVINKSMKFFSPLIDCLHVGLHKSICTSFNGLVEECSLGLKDTFVYFPFRHSLHTVFVGLLRIGRPITFWFLLMRTRLSKFTCPKHLCHNQFSST